MDAFSSKLKHWTASLADPRLFQIFSLGILLATGAYFRDFSIRPEQVLLTFAACLLTQAACWTLTPSKPRTLRSAIITCFSVTLLLRADNLRHPITAATAIFEVHFAAARQASVQSGQFWRAPRAGDPARRLDIGRAMGPGHRLCRMDGWDGQYRDAAHAPRRYQLDVSGLLRRRTGAARHLAGAAMGRAGASVEQRRAAAVRLLHDLGPDDDPQPPARPRGPRGDGLRNRVRVAVLFLPDQRLVMGAANRGPVRSAVGQVVASAEISMEQRRRKQWKSGGQNPVGS